MATGAVEIPIRKVSLRERLDLGNGLTPYFLVLPVIIVTVIGLFLPILISLWLSFLNKPPGTSDTQFIGLSNYIQLVTNSQFRSSLSTTLIFTLVAVTLETVFGFGIALLLHETFPGRGVLRAAILIPWAFPLLLSAQMWYVMYNDRTGIISYFLQQLHILPPGATLLQSNSGIIAAAIIVDERKNTPFMAILILAGLQVIPPEVYEASKVDGANRFQQFWTITLPLLNGPLTVALLFRTLAALGVFELFYILGGNQVQSMATYSYNYMFTRSTFDFPPGVAAAVVLFLIVILQIAYRFSAMMVVLKSYVKITSSPPKAVQRKAKQVESIMTLDEKSFVDETVEVTY